MLSYQIYKLAHFAGIMMLFIGLGGLLVSAYAGHANLKSRAKILAFTFHGLGLLLILVGGFGMLARLGLVNGLPVWIYIKLLLWLTMGIAVSLAKRSTKAAWLNALLFVGIGVSSAALALYKPWN
jgi:hypothetical protein